MSSPCHSELREESLGTFTSFDSCHVALLKSGSLDADRDSSRNDCGSE